MVLIHRAIALVAALTCITQGVKAQCGETDTCQAMNTKRRQLLKGHIAKTKDDKHLMCSHILIAHALHYKPNENCIEAQNLYKHIKKTCLSELTTILPHAPLCHTKAQHTLGAIIALHIVAVITTAVATEWNTKASRNYNIEKLN